MLVVPLLREPLLHGETRPLDVFGVERDLAIHLATLPVGTEVCAATVASAVGVPTFLRGRFEIVDVPKEVVYVTRVHEVVGALPAAASDGNGTTATRKSERTAPKSASTARGKRASRGAS